MSKAETFLMAYWIALNLIAFVQFGRDKRKAKKGRSRIPEKRLHLIALLGGFVGGFIGMILFHHKTRKPAFLAVFIFASLLSGTVLLYLWIKI